MVIQLLYNANAITEEEILSLSYIVVVSIVPSVQVDASSKAGQRALK